MFYHKIKYDDQLNGEGLRVVLFVSGCNHHCDGCHNPETWNCNSGIPFDKKAEEIIFNYLEKDYIDGITFSGGDPLHPNNCIEVFLLMDKIKKKFPDKTIWLYTGYTYEELKETRWIQYVYKYIDVLVDGGSVRGMKEFRK